MQWDTLTPPWFRDRPKKSERYYELGLALLRLKLSASGPSKTPDALGKASDRPGLDYRLQAGSE